VPWQGYWFALLQIPILAAAAVVAVILEDVAAAGPGPQHLAVAQAGEDVSDRDSTR
jgi:hypothetical protein